MNAASVKDAATFWGILGCAPLSSCLCTASAAYCEWPAHSGVLAFPRPPLKQFSFPQQSKRVEFIMPPCAFEWRKSLSSPWRVCRPGISRFRRKPRHQRLKAKNPAHHPPLLTTKSLPILKFRSPGLRSQASSESMVLPPDSYGNSLCRAILAEASLYTPMLRVQRTSAG